MIYNDVFRTAVIITVAVASVFAVGFCVVDFASRRLKFQLTSDQFWSAVPLVGAGVLILVCQNLLYLDLRVRYSAILVWICVATYLARRLSVFAASRDYFPWKLVATGIAIYLVHGSGLLVSGASNYYGYGWVDMYNYVSQAQFFVDFPYSSALDTHEYLRTAHFYKHDRIGQSVLHAFVAASSGADAQQAFGATILLSPMLIFFALYLLSISMGFKRRFAYSAAIVASLSPAVASVHLECFFSQAMAMPFIYLWPLVVANLQSDPGIRSTSVAGLLFSVTLAIYAELVPPLVFSSMIVLFTAYWLDKRKNILSPSVASCEFHLKRGPSSFISFFIAIAVGLICNIGYIRSAFIIMGRTTGARVLDDIYPWAFDVDGLARLWLGNQVVLPESGWYGWIVTCSATCIVAAVAHVLLRIFRKFDSLDIFAILIVAIPLGPLSLSMLTGSTYPYQFYKLLLIVWPLIIFFAVSGVCVFVSQYKKERGLILLQMVLVCICLVLTNRIAFASTKVATYHLSRRGGGAFAYRRKFQTNASRA